MAKLTQEELADLPDDVQVAMAENTDNGPQSEEDAEVDATLSQDPTSGYGPLA